jgi:hypothetical protein
MISTRRLLLHLPQLVLTRTRSRQVLLASSS